MGACPGLPHLTPHRAGSPPQSDRVRLPGSASSEGKRKGSWAHSIACVCSPRPRWGSCTPESASCPEPSASWNLQRRSGHLPPTHSPSATFFFFFSFGHTWKFPDKGSNQSNSSDNTGCLTTRPPGNSPSQLDRRSTGTWELLGVGSQTTGGGQHQQGSWGTKGGWALRQQRKSTKGGLGPKRGDQEGKAGQVDAAGAWGEGGARPGGPGEPWEGAKVSWELG